LLQVRPGSVDAPLPTDVTRVEEARPTEAATAVSQRRFAAGAASHVVLARHDVFADALAGAALTAKGPLLLTERTVLPELTAGELRRVLPDDGHIYLLGGPQAIGTKIEETLTEAGYRVTRLAGETRYETAVAVGDVVRSLNPDVKIVALARSNGRTATDSAAWADSVTGGAWAARAGVPILVTGTKGVHPAVAAALTRWRPQRTVLFGGEQALSAAVAEKVPHPMRVAGDDRAATAAAISSELWSQPRGYVFTNGYRDDGWAFGLAAAGLAADLRAPLLVVNRDLLPEATRRHLSGCRIPSSNYTLIGGHPIIGSGVEAALVEATSC
jgi:hypothetical protein